MNAAVSGGGVGATTSTTNKRLTRTPDRLGNVQLSEIRLLVGGYAVPQGGVETAIGNDIIVAATKELSSGTRKRLTWAGQQSVTVPSGAAEVVSDPLYPSDLGLSNFAALSDDWWRIERQCVAGGNLPFGLGVPVPSITGQRTVQMADTAASQVDATGTPTTGGATGATNINTFPLPLAVLGRAANGQDFVSVIVEGNSLAEGRNDGIGNGLNGGGGWIIRGLVSAGIPFTNLAVGATTVGQSSPAVRRETLYKYATHLLLDTVRNDWATGRTSAAILADIASKSARAKAAGIKRVIVSIPYPDTNRVDTGLGWTAANQVVKNSGWETVRQQIKTAFLTNPSAYGIDEVIDLTSIVADAGNTSVWADDMTNDGTHYTAAAAGLMAAALASRAATWVAN